MWVKALILIFLFSSCRTLKTATTADKKVDVIFKDSSYSIKDSLGNTTDVKVIREYYYKDSIYPIPVKEYVFLNNQQSHVKQAQSSIVDSSVHEDVKTAVTEEKTPLWKPYIDWVFNVLKWFILAFFIGLMFLLSLKIYKYAKQVRS
ncbi:hypothetical protein [Polluticaenibacter yanchengensis]|uniref:Lipoprotein n=1 Tax=Polluticaenibacter yanchengensis TaxID=3014562 RepID=A0ABT4UIN6_9BACT|nr:hypothetical protein [Chitinophagaceae bacterium LY-5]